MKKTLLFLSILPSILFAHIGQIQTHEKPYEFVVGSKIYRKVATDAYYLRIDSDNEFEDKTATLDLGIGPSQALTSLSNLYALYDQGESDFNLQGYRFGVRGGYIFAYKSGPLEYAAGDYILRRNTHAYIMREFIRKTELPIGDMHVSYADNATVYVHYDTYGFRDVVNFYNMTLPWSREYSRGDTISDDDLRILLKAIQTPNNYRSKTAKSGAYVLEKDQVIKACETILNK